MTNATEHGPQTAPEEIERRLLSLPRELLQAVTAAESRSAAREQIVGLVASTGVARAVFLLQRDDQGELLPAVVHEPEPMLRQDPVLLKGTLAAAEMACRLGEAQIVRRPAHLVATPIFLRGAAPDALILLVEPETVEVARQVGVVAANHATLAQLLGDFAELGETVRSSAAMLELLERIEQAESVQRACGELADQLQRYFDCRRVAVGTCPKQRHCRLEALSGAKRFDKHAEFARAVEAALDEAILRDTATLFPPQDAQQRHALRAHERLARLAEVPCVVSLPLRDGQGEIAGGWLLMGEEAQLASPAALRFLETLAPQVTQSLNLLRRARHASWLGRLKRGLGRRKTLFAVLLAGLTLALLSMPMPYRLGCDCDLQPTTRRYVAAPYDGKLAQVLVGPGDLVASDQLLARLDGREIQWELDTVLVDLDKARKSHDTALAKQKVAEAQLARLEMDRLALQQRLLENRITRLEIKSPIAGMVLSGDLERTEGAPLNVGQTLFEIAPLEQMVVELAVPESEIAHVLRDDPVTVTLDAYPTRKWSGKIEKVRPRAELVDKESVFVAEMSLNNANGLLRPGMKGRAKIQGRRHPLVWNLFHKPYEAIIKAYHGL